MSRMQVIGEIIGFLIVAVTLWNIIRNGLARSNGNVDGVNSYDLSQGGDGFPPA